MRFRALYLENMHVGGQRLNSAASMWHLTRSGFSCFFLCFRCSSFSCSCHLVCATCVRPFQTYMN